MKTKMKDIFTREEVEKMLNEIVYSNWTGYHERGAVSWETDEGNITTEELINRITPEMKSCMDKPCNNTATIDYNGHGHWVCKDCYDSLSRYFDEEYK